MLSFKEYVLTPFQFMPEPQDHGSKMIAGDCLVELIGDDLLAAEATDHLLPLDALATVHGVGAEVNPTESHPRKCDA